jgi:hypothetical protein
VDMPLEVVITRLDVVTIPAAFRPAAGQQGASGRAAKRLGGLGLHAR